jgi:hypothetical protein
MPVYRIDAAQPLPSPAVTIEFFAYGLKPSALLAEIAAELRRKDRHPVVIFDTDLLSLEDHYALVRVVSACPPDRDVLLHTPMPDSHPAITQKLFTRWPVSPSKA